MHRQIYPVVMLLTAFLLACSIQAFTKEPIFVPVKIDGPVHDPAKGSYWYGPFSEACAVFDLNGDGHLDITCGGNWYEGPQWKKHENFRGGATIHGEYINNCGEFAMDVNGDGKLDIVSAGWMENGVFWYENPGKPGAKWKATKIMASDWTEGLVVEDIDGDGDHDILINHWSKKEGQGVTWLEKLKGPEFTAHVLGEQGDTHGMGLGDLNRDGRKDILTSSGWWEAPEDRAKGKWQFHAAFRLEHSAGIQILVFDADGDGLNDIVYGHAHNYGLGWFRQVATTKSGGVLHFEHQPLIEESRGQFHTLVLADVNQDGRLDVVTGKRLRGHAGRDPSAYDPLGVYWYEVKGGKFVRHVLSYNHLPWYPDQKGIDNPPPNHAIGAGMSINVLDVNKDTLVDIVVAGKSGLYLFLNRGLPPTKPLQ